MTMLIRGLTILFLLTVSTAHGSESAADLYEKGVSFHKAGHLKDALAAYKQALEIRPGHLEAQYGAAVVLYQQLEYKAARIRFRDVLTRNPSDVRALFFLGRSELALGNMEQSKKRFRLLLARHPRNVDSMIAMGEAEYDAGNIFTGEDWLRQALELEPGNDTLKEAYLKMKELNRKYLRAKEKEKRRAIADALNRAISLERLAWAEQWGREGQEDIEENELEPENYPEEGAPVGIPVEEAGRSLRHCEKNYTDYNNRNRLRLTP